MSFKNFNRWGCGFPNCCWPQCCIPEFIGPQETPAPECPSGLLDDAFIAARLTMPVKLSLAAPIPFPHTVANRQINLPPPFTTFHFEEKGYYLLNLSLTGNINQIQTVVTECKDSDTTNYTFSPNVESKSLTAIIPVTKNDTTLQLLNCSMNPCTEIFSAYITIVKIAKVKL